MPFTLDQLNFLGVHVGVAISPEFIENKRREQEYLRHLEEFSARADAIKKRADGPELELLLEKARAAAGKKNFAEALKFLAETEERLKRPDIAPEVLAALEILIKRKAAL